MQEWEASSPQRLTKRPFDVILYTYTLKERNMINPIPRSGFFASPTLEQISDQIEVFPAEQKAQLYLVMQMTLNACHNLVESEHIKAGV